MKTYEEVMEMLKTAEESCYHEYEVGDDDTARYLEGVARACAWMINSPVFVSTGDEGIVENPLVIK